MPIPPQRVDPEVGALGLQPFNTVIRIRNKPAGVVL